MGLGISPEIVTLLLRAAGSGIGTAETRACVYGCKGLLNNSSVSASSTNFPKYIIAILSQTCLVVARSCVM